MKWGPRPGEENKDAAPCPPSPEREMCVSVPCPPSPEPVEIAP